MITAVENQTKELTCAEKIGSELADREERLVELFAKVDDDDSEMSDEAREEVSEMAYGIDVYSVAKVTWSGGGPADWIEITYNKHDLIKVEYVYQDWFDGARLTVDEDSAVYRYAEEMLEWLSA